MHTLINYTQILKQGIEGVFSYFSSRSISEILKDFLVLKGDKAIWLSVLFLLAMGSLLFFSTSLKLLNKDELTVFNIFLTFLKKHLIYVVSGLVIMLVMQRANYQYFLQFSKFGVLFMILVMLVTVNFGINEGGANRKLIIPGIGSIQPAEFAKVFVILDIAASLSKLSRTKKEDISYWSYYLSLGLSGLLILMVGLNSNSAALILICTLLAMILISPVPKKELRRAVLYLCFGIIPIMIWTSEKFRFNVFVERMELFLDKDLNGRDGIGSPDIQDNNQQELAISAVATTKIPIGKLPGGSEIKSSLPLAYSDFVYSILVEEYGMIGGIAVIIAYMFLIYKAYKSLSLTQTHGGSYLVFGLIFYMSIQAMIHIFVNIGLLPVTGQTLPFVSQGGASIWASAIAIGMVLSVVNTDKG
jgi:cell division protein FtsW